jgi:hypothetical protein
VRAAIADQVGRAAEHRLQGQLAIWGPVVDEEPERLKLSEVVVNLVPTILTVFVGALVRPVMESFPAWIASDSMVRPGAAARAVDTLDPATTKGSPA